MALRSFLEMPDATDKKIHARQRRSPNRLRFRLRTLLLVTIGVGCGLGWWLRPHTIEEHWPNGRLKCRFTVRRNWNGELLTHGEQAWWWGNGQLARRGMSYGEKPPRQLGGIQLSLSNAELFTWEGEPLRGDDPVGLVWLTLKYDGIPLRGGLGARRDDVAIFPETPH